MSVYKAVTEAVNKHKKKRISVHIDRADNGGYIADTQKDGEYPGTKTYHKTSKEVAKHVEAMCK